MKRCYYQALSLVPQVLINTHRVRAEQGLKVLSNQTVITGDRCVEVSRAAVKN